MIILCKWSRDWKGGTGRDRLERLEEVRLEWCGCGLPAGVSGFELVLQRGSWVLNRHVPGFASEWTCEFGM